jgi:hypothetical protein
MFAAGDVVGVVLKPNVSVGENSVTRAIVNNASGALVHRYYVSFYPNILQPTRPIGALV